MGEEFLEMEYKFLLITLDKIMKTGDLCLLRRMFSHATDQLELIFRNRYKKLLDKEVVQATKKIVQDYCNNDDIVTKITYGRTNRVYDISDFTYIDTDSIKIEKEDKTNETTNS